MNVLTAISDFIFESNSAELIGWTILHSLWQVTLLAALFYIARWIVANRQQASPVSTYWLGCLTLVLMAAAPVATFIQIEPSAVVVQLEPRDREALAGKLVNGTSESRFLLLPNKQSAESSQDQEQRRAITTIVTTEELNKTSDSTTLGTTARLSLPYLTACWFFGALLFSIRPVFGLCQVQILKTSACPKLSDHVRKVAKSAVERTGLKQTVEFATSRMIEIPTVVGVWKPIVLFPVSVLTQLTPEQLETIIIHELAHVQRHDYVANLFQTVIETMLFFHPCVWWVSMIVRAEREKCCDDVAVELGDVKAYAVALFAIEKARHVPVPALGANGSDLVARIRRLVMRSVDRRELRQQQPWQATFLTLLLLTVLVVVVQRPALVTAANALQADATKIDNPTQIRNDFAKTKLGKVLDNEMEKLKQVGFSGSILVAHRGQIILAKSEGFLDVKRSGKVKPNTLYEIASFSKSFTSTAAMILTEQGKLKLDASIADYLPSVPDNCKGITVRHLMQHVSGMPRDNYGETDQDLKVAVKTMLAGGPKTEPGKVHAYWNQGYILLSEIVAKASGKPFKETVKELIFDPCDMKGTCFTGDDAPRGFEVSTGTGRLGPPRTCLEHPYGKFELVYQGTGGIVSNVHDIWKFHIGLNGNKLLSEDSKEAMFDTRGITGDYALGWRVAESTSGTVKQSHGGSVRGFNCFFVRFPESDSCIVVLCNNNTIPGQMISNVIESIVFPPNLPAALAADDAKKYEGEYKDARGRIMNVELMDGQLHYSIIWSQNAPVSRGLILQNEKDEVILYQPGDQDVVEVQLSDDMSKVESISLPSLELKFIRAK